jgi:hypothetical protein
LGILATPDEYKALNALLHSGDEACDKDKCHYYKDGYRYFEIEYEEGAVFVFANKGWRGCWRALPPAFLTLLGALIARNGLRYLEFGVAWVGPFGIAGGTYSDAQRQAEAQNCINSDSGVTSAHRNRQSE